MIDAELLIFGAGSHARKLARALRSTGRSILAFVTTQPSSYSHLDGIPVHSWETLPERLRGKRQVACGIFNRSDAYNKLATIMQANQFSRILWPWDYYPILCHQLGWCYWLDHQPKPLSAWQQDESYRELIFMLADEESKSIVNRILAFRQGEDLDFASYTSLESQYFNPITLTALPLNRPICFLDIGAYDGDTLQALCRQVKVAKAVLIEPDPQNFAQLKRRLDLLTHQYTELNPYALPVGAGDQYGFFSLAGEGEGVLVTTAEDISHSKHCSVTVVPLDDVIPADHFDFIKIDVEGSDLAALQGIQKLARRSHAILAISLYHRPHDIIEIPRAVMGLLRGLSYQYFIRQHMCNSFETVLYAVPSGGR